MLLTLDTSGPILSLGLFDGSHPIAETREHIGRGHAEHLLPTIRTLLNEADTKPSELTRIVVVVGPGSFMGLRVGIASARAMALGLGIQAVGVSRMRALARPHGAVHVALDARRGQVFAQAFDAANEPMDELAAVPLEEFQQNGSVGGSGAALLGIDAVFTDDAPALADIAALALSHPLPPHPLYGRGADAKPQQSPVIRAEAHL